MSAELDSDDRRCLHRAVDLSRRALTEDGKAPFGAVLVVAGTIAGEGTSSVAERHDPTAHAEVLALRAAGAALRRHRFEDGVLYSSSEPCPMCLAACYWAGLPRLVFATTSRDVAAAGFEDLRYYREFSLDRAQRSLREDAAGGEPYRQAAGVLSAWAERLPERVRPEF